MVHTYEPTSAQLAKEREIIDLVSRGEKLRLELAERAATSKPLHPDAHCPYDKDIYEARLAMAEAAANVYAKTGISVCYGVASPAMNVEGIDQPFHCTEAGGIGELNAVLDGIETLSLETADRINSRKFEIVDDSRVSPEEVEDLVNRALRNIPTRIKNPEEFTISPDMAKSITDAIDTKVPGFKGSKTAEQFLKWYGLLNHLQYVAQGDATFDAALHLVDSYNINDYVKKSKLLAGILPGKALNKAGEQLGEVEKNLFLFGIARIDGTLMSENFKNGNADGMRGILDKIFGTGKEG